MFDEKYNNCSIIRPNKLRGKNGNWTVWSHRKFKQVNHVVAHLDGRAFYVGAYKCVKSTELDEKRFKRLPKEVRLLLTRRS